MIAQSGSGSNTTITVRRVFQGVGVEMNFHLHSPVLGSLEVLRRAKVGCALCDLSFTLFSVHCWPGKGVIWSELVELWVWERSRA